MQRFGVSLLVIFLLIISSTIWFGRTFGSVAFADSVNNVGKGYGVIVKVLDKMTLNKLPNFKNVDLEEGVVFVPTAKENAADVARVLSSQVGVVYAEVNNSRTLPWIRDRRARAPEYIPPGRPYMWHLTTTNTDLVHKNGTVGNRSVTMAIVDTGVWPHSHFYEKMLTGYDFSVGRDSGQLDMMGHGTHVAGIANSICPDCMILPVKVFDDDGFTNDLWVSQGIRYAANFGTSRLPMVINLSLGGAAPNRTLCDAVEYAHRKGVMVVAAAGNSSQEGNYGYPALCAREKNLIVSATNRNDELALFSNFGTEAVAAPGDEIVSTFAPIGGMPVDSYVVASGTSMAAPMITGALGLRNSVTGENLTASVAKLMSTLDQTVSGRRLNVARLMDQGDGRPVVSGATVATPVVPRTGGVVEVSAFVQKATVVKVFLKQDDRPIRLGSSEDGLRMSVCEHDATVMCGQVKIPDGVVSAKFDLVVVAHRDDLVSFSPTLIVNRQ